MTIDAVKVLFDLAAKHGDKNKLIKVIQTRCEDLMQKDDTDEIRKLKNIWFIRAFFFLPDNEITNYWDWLKADGNSIFLFNNRASDIRFGTHENWPTLSANKIWMILDEYIDKWPKVDLPSSWGSDSPDGETAYRFLTEVIWGISKDISDDSLEVVNRLMSDSRFEDFQLNLKNIRTTIIKTQKLNDFKAPSVKDIVAFFDKDSVISVENLRALILEELQSYQADLEGGDTTNKDVFYNLLKNKPAERIGEVKATERIADRLRLKIESRGITVNLEGQMNNANRCDISITKVFENKRRLLVMEVKGQWHTELYSAIENQLSEKYSIHPDAENQGIYLVLWFGGDEKIAGKENKKINSPQALKESICEAIPVKIKGLIDVFVLDLSIK